MIFVSCLKCERTEKQNFYYPEYFDVVLVFALLGFHSACPPPVVIGFLTHRNDMATRVGVLFLPYIHVIDESCHTFYDSMLAMPK